MVRFGNHLHEAVIPAWAALYIDYDKLKTMIRSATRAKEEAGTHPETKPAYEAHKAAFQVELDAQVEKVIEFYKSQELKCLEEAVEALHNAKLCLQGAAGIGVLSHECLHEMNVALATVQHVNSDVTNLLQYVSLNMIAIRKILKKYAKNVEPIAPVPGCLTLEVGHPDDAKWRVLQGSFLPQDKAADLDSMQQQTQLLAVTWELADVLHQFQHLLNSNPEFVDSRNYHRQSVMEQRLIEATEQSFQAVRAAAESARRNASYVHAVPWVERAAGMFEPPPPDNQAVATMSGLVLNNLSTLLFMANYSAVLPPTDRLCEHIGISSSWTGFIVGASDAAAIVASIGISIWTQVSFKGPLLFSATSCLLGNLVFVSSYAFQSFPLLIVSRLLNGLGSARTANRRYTADYVSRAQRTVASAAFVGCSNLGQALGPFLSLPLARLSYRYLLGLPVNPITTIGLIMALLWLIFFFATAVFFEEPVSPRFDNDSLSLITAPLLSTDRLENGEATNQDNESPDRTARSDLRKHSNRRKKLLDVEGLKATPWWPTLPGTVVCVSCLFLQKAMQQAYLDAVPLVTGALLSWESSQKSMFLGCMGLAMVPVNALVAVMSSRVHDVTLVFLAVGICCAAMIALARGLESLAFYFIGGGGLFIGTVVIEGAATSLMSKVIWSGFAQGIFNAGLLSTEAGTFGRFSGNAILTMVGGSTGVSTVGQLSVFSAKLYGGLAVGCLILAVLLAFTHGRLRQC
jgi:hypothetical protein